MAFWRTPETIVAELDECWDKYQYRGYLSADEINDLEVTITALIDELRTATF